MQPPPGEHLLRYVGDVLDVSLVGVPEGGAAFLRTNLGRGEALRAELVALAGSAGEARTFAGGAWRDLPLRREGEAWRLPLPLLEPGAFRAKAYARDREGRQHWPAGSDLVLSVHPDALRTANAVYCAFPRLLVPGGVADLPAEIQALDRAGYTVIPPSGTLRSLTRALPHIFGDLGCRILHLLPLGPVPTTFARMGRYGSPYAQLDLTQIDPALVEFDRRATAEDQFRELADGVRRHGGMLMLDIVLNHTGWGSRLMSRHPEWFKRKEDGSIQSPGAWGTTWEDLAELDPAFKDLWKEVADALLTWCRRGVDGFRCDAGYMLPVPLWEFLMARVRQEFPDTVFLLEGLGGGWEDTADRLTAGMQWAYSELFQNHGPREVSGYLDHALHQGARLGPLLHFSETHDNLRLAAKGAAWSLMRNRLSALASQSGAWGFTSGVEWLATEKIDVHGASDLRWGEAPNLVRELGALNRLLASHPCFFDGARVTRVSPPEAWVLALLRESADGRDRGLALVNLDSEGARSLELPEDPRWEGLTRELLGQAPPEDLREGGRHGFRLPAGWAGFLVPESPDPGRAGGAYRLRRAQAAWALEALRAFLPAEGWGAFDWKAEAARAAQDGEAFLAGLRHLDRAAASQDLEAALDAALQRGREAYPAWVAWGEPEARRTTLVPPGHPVLVRDPDPFTLHVEGLGEHPRHLRSTPFPEGHRVVLPPAFPERTQDVTLWLERHGERGGTLRGALRLLPEAPALAPPGTRGLALLTNGRGGYARIPADPSQVTSKYDALLAANLDPRCPSERHVLAKRVRLWAIADGFLTALDAANLEAFQGASPARWTWAAHAGDGRRVRISMTAWMPPGADAVLLRLERHPGFPGDLRLTVRLDLEDRGHHGETEANEGADRHFNTHTRPLADRPGFAFAPAADRSLRAFASRGAYHPAPEWSLGIPHPLEASRGQRDRGDAWSPGWFDLPLAEGDPVSLWLTAEADEPLPSPPTAPAPPRDLEGALRSALPAYLARRGEGATLLAGYPWFLDWGRDALIGCRGLLTSGHHEAALSILRTFGALERRGTLPNALFGGDDANRESSDAPLWFGLACEEAVLRLGPACLEADCGGRSLREVLASIGRHYLGGTPTGVRVDPGSGLVFSPAHFTWMDTNHPAGTPREGYPIELQALWIRLLEGLEARQEPGGWAALAARARTSLEAYWREAAGCAADTLHAAPGQPAKGATADDHVRPNQLWTVTLGLWRGERARRLVQACGRHLLVPGALRSLAPLPVAFPLPILGPGGRPLNDPHQPYQGRYEGDEDTRRKPAYHNGTAWIWLLPLYAEALAAAWPGDAVALGAARAILGSVAPLLATGCLGHLPELLDGDAPHTPRGCDAQAWSVTEVMRVWLNLNALPGPGEHHVDR